MQKTKYHEQRLEAGKKNGVPWGTMTMNKAKTGSFIGGIGEGQGGKEV